MLKTTRLPDKPTSSKNNSSKSVSSKNNNSKPVSKRNDSNGEVNGFGINRNDVKHAKKSGKLSKSGKSKSKKTSKSQNLAKSGKKSSKSGNSTNFNATEDGPKFLTPDAKTTFNRLRLAFAEASILRFFDPECHIQIKTDASSYDINGVLSLLTSGINLDGIVTKVDFS